MKITTSLAEIKRIDKELNEMKSKKIIVGVLAEEEVDGVSIIDYATINEYGTSKIPARPFFRTATQWGKSPQDIKKFIDKEVEKVIENGKSGNAALDAIGLYVKGKIIKSLKKGPWTPNAPATLKHKAKKGGGSKPPLIDTSSLVKAIDYEIKGR